MYDKYFKELVLPDEPMRPIRWKISEDGCQLSTTEPMQGNLNELRDYFVTMFNNLGIDVSISIKNCHNEGMGPYEVIAKLSCPIDQYKNLTETNILSPEQINSLCHIPPKDRQQSTPELANFSNFVFWKINIDLYQTNNEKFRAALQQEANTLQVKHAEDTTGREKFAKTP